jgi:hypothetical protein
MLVASGRARFAGPTLGQEGCTPLPLPRSPMNRVAVLLVLVAAFAPAAVLGALPLVLLATVSLTAVVGAVSLLRPPPEPLPAAQPQSPGQ